VLDYVGAEQTLALGRALLAAGHLEISSTTYPLDEVMTAWSDLLAGRVLGRAVVVP
jgi:D-arabinose 1-dehydrogenase-like Zn-dependent alcohol dehydrogenase